MPVNIDPAYRHRWISGLAPRRSRGAPGATAQSRAIKREAWQVVRPDASQAHFAGLLPDASSVSHSGRFAARIATVIHRLGPRSPRRPPTGRLDTWRPRSSSTSPRWPGFVFSSSRSIALTCRMRGDKSAPWPRPTPEGLAPANEKSERKLNALNVVSTLAAQFLVIEVPGIYPWPQAREVGLSCVIARALEIGAARVVTERDDTNLARDRRTASAALRGRATNERPVYVHMRAFEEPLLWVPDLIVWCWSKDGHWRPRLFPTGHRRRGAPLT